MLRRLIILLLGVCLGAAVFHVFYLKLGAAKKCGWDHPLDDRAALACRRNAVDDDAGEDSNLSDGTHAGEAGSKARGYATRARHELDDLVRNVVR